MTARSKISAALVLSVAVVGVVGVRPGSSLYAEEPKHRNSAKLAKPLKEAHDDLAAKKYPEAIAKLKEADGTAGKTPYDQHLINDMLAFAYIGTSDYADTAKAMEAEIEDGFTPANELTQKIRALAALNYQLKNYDEAIAFGLRAIEAGNDDENMQNVVGEAYYLNGNWKGTLKFEDELVTAEIKQGERPRKILLQLLYSACVKLKDSGCAARALERLKRYYPGTWRPDLITPEVPVGEVLADYFGQPQDVKGQKRFPAFQDDSRKTD